MAHISADRVRDTTTTTGTGTITVSGTAPSGYRTFSAVCATSDTFYYCIAHQAAAEWEVGVGTYSAANQFTRTVISSSNANAAVSFSAGTKDVFITLPATKTMLADRTPMFSAYANATQNINSATFTKVVFQAEEFDTNGFFDSTTNFRFLPTIAGYYQVNAAVSLNRTSTTEFNLSVYKNGTAFADGSDADYGYVSVFSQLVLLNGSTDYLEVYAWQGSAGTLSLISGRRNTVFQAYLVRPT